MRAVMEIENNYKESKLTPEKALVMLREEGLDVSLEQATEILYFLRKLANIAVSNYLRERK
jgi:hypothetical protein